MEGIPDRGARSIDWRPFVSCSTVRQAMCIRRRGLPVCLQPDIAQHTTTTAPHTCCYSAASDIQRCGREQHHVAALGEQHMDPSGVRVSVVLSSSLGLSVSSERGGVLRCSLVPVLRLAGSCVGASGTVLCPRNWCLAASRRSRTVTSSAVRGQGTVTVAPWAVAPVVPRPR